mgnify:FL=1
MSIKEYIGGQFADPEGLGGIACAKFMNIFNAEHYRAVKKFVCKLDGARILDIGFGNGVTIKKLSKSINAKFYGVDISADMVEKAKRENRDGVNTNKVILQQGKAEELPYNDDFFDTVYTVNTIYFWEDTAKVLDEVRRVLKDGGNFICTFYTKGYLDKLPYCDTGFDKFTPQQVRSMARERGFHDVKVKILSDCKAYCLVGTKIEGE